MARPKVIFLTTETLELNDIGKNKIEKAVKDRFNRGDEETPKQYSRRWYDSMGITPPDDAEDDENEDGILKLDDDEVDVIENDILLERSEFSHCIDGSTSTIVYTKSGHFFEVTETSDIIYDQIRYLDQSIIERIINELKIKYYKIKNK